MAYPCLMTSSPCNWTVAFNENCDTTAFDSLDEPTREAVSDMAVRLLWTWTGRRFGLCDQSVRPCRDDCARMTSAIFPNGGPTTGGSGWLPALIDGQWFNLRCGACRGDCSCGISQRVALELPGMPTEIVSVWIEGEELPAESYTLRDGTLYRVDGLAWPSCNDPIGDPRQADSGAWEVTYTSGVEVPRGGTIAAGLLAVELAKAICQDRDCQLPQRVQSVTRQGVSIGAVLDSFDDLQKGRTGIWVIDSWIASEGAERTARPAVYSPDSSRQRGTLRSLGIGRRR